MRYHYSKWDGTQEIESVDAKFVFDQLSDDLLYNGDVASALRELMSRGFRRPDGTRVQGLTEMIEKLRKRRAELLRSRNLSSVYDSIREELDSIVAMETAALDEAEHVTNEIDPSVAQHKRLELSAMSDDLAQHLKDLRGYEFFSAPARQRLEKLISDLRDQLIQSTFSQMKGSLSNMDAKERQRLAQMLGALNDLLSKRAQGLDVDEDFSMFKDEYGDMIPDVSSLDELLELMAGQAAAMASFMASLDEQQRMELSELFEELLGDLDLAWQLDMLAENLSSLGYAPNASPVGLRGDQDVSLGEVGELFSELTRIDQLEAFFKNPPSSASLADLDLSEVGELLGDDANRSLAELAKLAKSLQEKGLIDNHGGFLRISPKGLRHIADKALEELFSKLKSSGFGEHPSWKSGFGSDLEYQTKPYEFGDSFNVSINQTLKNATLRQGMGFPIKVSADDFEVERTEAVVSTSTVLLLDLSLSMPLRDNFLPAKKVAVALSSLVRSKFPRDFFSLIGFSEVAREIPIAELPSVTWDYVYGTNIAHALALGRKMLKGQRGTKQIILVTDGEPTSHVLPSGEIFFSYPTAPETLKATLSEVVKCTKGGIAINSFVLDADDHLKRFMDKLVRVNGGRVFYTSGDKLGGFVLVDFLANRRSSL
ncbi:MAG: hypothetical protein HKL81_04770 [Acidimicrobiaceae bacterium]|nr:hypothetical protein [Acidimicrobiaceae bacterium]